MNPAQANGINPALLAAYQNAQSQHSQSQFNLQPQFTSQQQPGQFQQSPSTPSKFPYNGMQQSSYQQMYNGGQFMNSGGGGGGGGAANTMTHGSMMTPNQVVLAGLMHHGVNPTQMLANGRQPQQVANVPQMNTGQIFQKPAGAVNGMNPGSLPATVGQQMPGIPSAQIAQLAGMNPQERQKAMMYLQHQHQYQRTLQQQQLAQQNMQQGVQQTPQPTQQQIPFDRPPSSMSSHQGMMPPPPRPPTSMSRPGTSHSHGPGQPPQNRPPSRPGTVQPMPQPGMTLPDGSTAGILHHQQGHDQGEIPGSPSRGAKRKLSGSNLAGQTPRMGSQPLPMGVQNLQTATMDGQPAIGNVQFPGIPMSGTQQVTALRPQFTGGSRQNVNGMMGGTPGMSMGPPSATRNQMPQMLDGTANLASDPFSSTGLPNLTNGLPHHVATPQLGAISGMPSGPLGAHPGSTPATAQMLAQVQQHSSLPGPGPSSVTPNLGALPPTLGGLPSGSNLPQNLSDPTRMSISSTNSMANLMSGNTTVPVNKLPGVINNLGIGRPGSISATNSMSLPPSTPGSSIPPLFPPTNPTAGTRTVSSNAPHLNPKVTQVTVVSLAASATEIATLSKEEIENVKQWMKSDKDHEELQRSARERMTEEVARIIRKPEWWEKDDQVVIPPSRSRRDKFSIGLSGARGIRRKAGQRMGVRLYVFFFRPIPVFFRSLIGVGYVVTQLLPFPRRFLPFPPHSFSDLDQERSRWKMRTGQSCWCPFGWSSILNIIN